MNPGFTIATSWKANENEYLHVHVRKYVYMYMKCNIYMFICALYLKINFTYFSFFGVLAFVVTFENQNCTNVRPQNDKRFT